jgi:N-dimethylarginine dimethylaminohydrolase
MLVVNPGTVIVDKYQSELIRKLEQQNFTVIPLELRHSRTLGGGFHCVTLDTRRQHA